MERGGMVSAVDVPLLLTAAEVLAERLTHNNASNISV